MDLKDDAAQEDGGDSDKRSGVIQSVSIAARFLTILTQSDRALALGELAKRAKSGRSTAHRYMQSLVKEGLVSQDQMTGCYDLGPAALSLGISALRRISPVEVATRHMKQLANEIGASCGVAIWTNRGPTVVQWFRSSSFAISTVTLGDVLPLDNTACGLVFQAYMPKDRVDVVRKVQPEPFRGSQPEEAQLEAIRGAGGAELDEHLFNALTGKAVPVFNAHGEIACVVTTVSFVKTARNERHFQALLKAGKLATTESGMPSVIEP